MNPENSNPEDARLRSLLREARPAPELPPRFQEQVWRRIADAESAEAAGPSWLDALIQRVLRPRLAFAGVTALVLAGALLGAREGTQFSRQDARANYLAAVAPNALR